MNRRMWEIKLTDVVFYNESVAGGKVIAIAMTGRFHGRHTMTLTLPMKLVQQHSIDYR